MYIIHIDTQKVRMFPICCLTISKTPKYIEMLVMCVLIEAPCNFIFKDNETTKKLKIICDINCGYKYRHSESKVLNVSYLPPYNILVNVLRFTSFTMYIFLLVYILRLSNYKKVRIMYDIDSGSKNINRYTQAESKVLNISYLLPDNIKTPDLLRFTWLMQYVSQLHAICQYVSQLHAICLSTSYLKTNKKKKRITYDINFWSSYTSTYRHSENKVFNVSYLPPDNIKDFQIFT